MRSPTCFVLRTQTEAFIVLSIQPEQNQHGGRKMLPKHEITETQTFIKITQSDLPGLYVGSLWEILDREKNVLVLQTLEPYTSNAWNEPMMANTEGFSYEHIKREYLHV